MGRKEEYRRYALGEKEIFKRHPNKLSIDQEIKRFGVPIGISWSEKATNLEHSIKSLRTRISEQTKKTTMAETEDRKSVPAWRRLLTTVERPKRVRLEGRAMEVAGTLNGGSSFVTNRAWIRVAVSSASPLTSIFFSLPLMGKSTIRLREKWIEEEDEKEGT